MKHLSTNHYNETLIVGWALPQYGSDGAMLFTQRQAAEFKKRGRRVEIFTICRPNKLADAPHHLSWGIIKSKFQGITYNILVRPYGILHTNPNAPLDSIHESKTTQIFLDFLERTTFDHIHFNATHPLELIEVAKTTGHYVTYTFHNFFLLYPHEHLFSHKKFMNNQCDNLTISTLNAQSAISEYQAYGSLPKQIDNAHYRKIENDFCEHLRYGKYLLEEVVDSIDKTHQRFVIAAAELFNMNLQKVSTEMQNPFQIDIDKASKIFLKKAHNKHFVFAEFANIQRFKGQHLLVYAVDYLHDYDGMFEVRLYGGAYDPLYYQQIISLIEADDFRKRHIRTMGAYSANNLPNIVNDVHFHIGTNPVYPYNSGSHLETTPLGVCPILKQDMIFEKLALHERDHLLSYSTGNVKELSSIMSYILEGKVDLKGCFISTSQSICDIENYRYKNEFVSC